MIISQEFYDALVVETLLDLRGHNYQRNDGALWLTYCDRWFVAEARIQVNEFPDGDCAVCVEKGRWREGRAP